MSNEIGNPTNVLFKKCDDLDKRVKLVETHKEVAEYRMSIYEKKQDDFILKTEKHKSEIISAIDNLKTNQQQRIGASQLIKQWSPWGLALLSLLCSIYFAVK